MKKGSKKQSNVTRSKKQSNVTRVLNFFREGDADEVRAVCLLMDEAMDGRPDRVSLFKITLTLASPKRRARKARLNGAAALAPSDVESHKERVAHALASSQGE